MGRDGLPCGLLGYQGLLMAKIARHIRGLQARLLARVVQAESLRFGAVSPEDP